MNKNIMGRTAYCFFALMVMLFCGTEVQAAPSFFTPSSGDRSIADILTPIFGGLFSTSVGGGSGPLIEILRTFNAAALSIGGIMAAYTLVAGTMQTAHDGEMLGKKWSSMWLPIRTTLGIGLAVPSATGYCVAQMLVAWITIQGIGLADKLWSEFASSTFSQKGVGPTAATRNVHDLALHLLKNEVCIAQGNAMLAGRGGAEAITKPYSVKSDPVPPDVVNIAENPTVSTGAAYVWNFGTESNENVCGTAQVNGTAKSYIDTSSSAFTGITATPNDNTSGTPILNAHQAAMTAMIAELQPLADEIVKDGGKAAASSGNALSVAAANYQKTVNAAAKGVFSGTDAFAAVKDAASKDGWIMAGAWFMRIAALQDVMLQATSAVPTLSEPKNLKSDAFKSAYEQYESYAANTTDSMGFTHSLSGGSSDTILKNASSFFTRHLVSAFKLDNDRHPVLAAKDLGDTVMVATEVAVVAGAGAMAVASGVAGIASTAGAVVTFSFVGNLLLALSIPLFAFGAGLSVYTPMIPFITFFGAAIGWILLVCEAVIAAPLWAVMHLTPTGDDVMGGARQGYMLLLGLLLRPALLIFGYVLCIVAIDPILKFYNGIFFPVFFANMGDSYVGLFTVMIGVGIYLGTLIFFMHKIFGLIHVIPDQLLQWIGGGSSQLGQMGGGAVEAGKQQKMALANSLGQGAMQISNSAGQASNAGRQKQAEIDGNAKAKLSEGRQASATGSEAMDEAGKGESLHEQAQRSGKAEDFVASKHANNAAATRLSEASDNARSQAGALRQAAKAPGTKQKDRDELNNQASVLESSAGQYDTAALSALKRVSEAETALK